MSERQVWDAYWKGKTSGCLPAAPAIEGLLNNFWMDIAEAMPKGARVLDLATGGGAVPRAMRRARSDLHLTGCDIASDLPPIEALDEVVTDIDMAHLPFDDASFGGLTSQFGLEYADVNAAVEEMARVADTPCIVALVMHRADSPIVAHNRPRRERLAWLLDERDAIGAARAAIGGEDKVLAELKTALIDRFDEPGVAGEFVGGLELVVERAAGGSDADAAAALAEMETAARHEIARISSLEGAAERADADAVGAQLERHGFEKAQRAAFAAGKGEPPYADALVTRRR